jgi:hypothetical protein
VRAEPSSASPRVETLEPGARVYVQGKVRGQSWYLVERDGQPLGYVFENLLVFDAILSPPISPKPKPKPEPPEDVPVVPPTRPVPLGDPDPPYEPGASFRCCNQCLETVMVPEGEFMMGSPESAVLSARHDHGRLGT